MQPSYALATLPRPVETPAGRFLVRPATVREAVLVYRSAWGAGQGQSGAKAVFAEVLGGWLPEELKTPVEAIIEAAGLEAALRHVIPLLEAGTEGLRFEQSDGGKAQNLGDTASPLERLAREDWDALVFDAAGVFGCAFTAVWDWPWPGFLYAISRMERVLARKQLRQGMGASLPWLGADGLARLQARASKPSATEADGTPVIEADPPMTEERWAAIRASRAALYQKLTGKEDPTGGGPTWEQYQAEKTSQAEKTEPSP